MIETGVPRKGGEGMTIRARCRKPRACVIRIGCVRVVGSVTADAGDWCSEVLIPGKSGVTILTIECGMLPHQGESGRLVPRNHIRDFPRLVRMASYAIRPKFGLVDIRMTGCAASVHPPNFTSL